MGKSKAAPKKPYVAAAEVVLQQISIQKVLEEAFLAIDNIIGEASAFSHKQTISVGTSKRFCAESERGNERTIENLSKRDFFTATLFLPLQQIGSAISTYGLQLLPAIHEISRRVLTLVSSPLLACAEAWETCARLCLYYGVGAVPVLREVVDFVLRESGVLLLDCPCFVIPELMEYLLFSMSPPPTNKVKNSTGTPLLSPSTYRLSRSQQDVDALLEQTERKFRSLRLMLAAAGDALNPVSLQQFSLRFSQEIVQDGLLSLSSSPTNDLQTAISAFQHYRTESGGGTVSNLNTVQWRIPSEWKAECVLLLDTLLGALRPVDMELLRSATLLAQSLYASTQRGMLMVPNHQLHRYQESVGETLSYPEVGASTLAAVTQLQRTLLLLRHPPFLPQSTIPETILMEQRQRRIFLEGESHTVREEISSPLAASREPDEVQGGTALKPSLQKEFASEIKNSLPIAPRPLPSSATKKVVTATDVSNAASSIIPSSSPPQETRRDEQGSVVPEIPTKDNLASSSTRSKNVQPLFSSESGSRVMHEEDDLPDIDLDD